ncbi:DUF4376 domain-containing protein [Phascolarctobacterium succinatutens]|uniref:DUF4376 domain-containing protein n=1 Tax=Phascolarctobacterium succinatutens TaxID=626940 RepID=UPI0026EFEF0C|nr:DUF4376 domain-containing protein [Phascolarctobacterium succinatutens]
MQQAYLFDEKTKEYKSEVNAQLDPLESARVGKDIYLLPANATWDKPTPKDGCVAVWNNESWNMLEDHRKQEYWLPEDKYGAPAREMKELGPLPEGAMLTAPERTLDEVKADKVQRLKTERDSKEVEPITYNGNSYDYDDKARERINAAIIALDVQGADASIDWTTATNADVKVTANDLRMVIAMVAQRSNALHIAYRVAKENIEQATTVADVEAVTLDA